jgi:adenosylcobinamide-GDP ribazoletransferase
MSPIENIRNALRGFPLALSFLTILRVPFHSTPEVTPDRLLARSFGVYPLVGAVLGVVISVMAVGLSPIVPPLLLAGLVTVSMAVLTRALHLDGLADFFDGIGGGYTPERRLEIMKDSRTGAFGATALACTVVIKAASVHSMVLLANWSPYARSEGGLGKPFLEGITSRDVLVALVFLLLFSVPVSPWLSLVCALGTLLGVLVMKRLSERFLGGITGDVLGATNEITEMLLLALSACFGRI